MMDRHKIWRIVRSNLEGLKEAAPEGYAPVVDVFLAGRPEPVRLGGVETSREPDFPWTLFSTEPAGDDAAASPDDCLVFAPEHYIERIELRFVRSEDRPLGFSHRTFDDEEPSSPSAEDA